METATTVAMNGRETQIGTFPKRSLQMNFTPTKTSTTESLMLKYTKRCIRPASIKYKARKPRMAKALEVHTTKVSVVIAKIAGIESTAKTTSVDSTAIRTASSGVAMSLPPSWTRSLFEHQRTPVNLSKETLNL